MRTLIANFRTAAAYTVLASVLLLACNHPSVHAQPPANRFPALPSSQLSAPVTTKLDSSGGATNNKTVTPSNLASGFSEAATDPAGSSERTVEQQYEQLAAEVAILERMSNVVRAVSNLIRPCVVHINASKVEQNRGRTESVEEAGSGVIIARGSEYWVLTNRHVVAGSRPAEITLKLSDGRRIFPTKVLTDELTDVAILAIQEPNLTAVRIGDSDRVAIGDFVVAVGSPFGLSHSVTFGIISARGRRDLTLGEERIELQDFIQTDAAINPGNSGGPLINLRGEVIGLNTAIASSSGGGVGIGFAIPINMVNRVVDQLAQYGVVKRGYLGVSLDPDFDASTAIRMGLGSAGGALVKTVRNASPARKAGIAVGDVITRFDNVDIESDDHLVTCVGLTPVDQQVDVIIFRSGKSYKTTVTITGLQD